MGTNSHTVNRFTTQSNRKPEPVKEPRPPRQNRPLTLREWWLSVREYEGQRAKPRPPWLVVP